MPGRPSTMINTLWELGSGSLRPLLIVSNKTMRDFRENALLSRIILPVVIVNYLTFPTLAFL